MASEKPKRCHYEVLGLSRDCSADEICSAYKKMALQRHPDKLVQSDLSQAEAMAQFQELAHAYKVLSDPKERAWYDSHRSQILFSDLANLGGSNSVVPNSAVPNLFSFFSNTVFTGYSDSSRRFYKVYSDLFDKIYANKLNFATRLGLGSDSIREAPVMGNLDSPYAQVSAFYNYWLGFATVMDFCWVEEGDGGGEQETEEEGEEGVQRLCIKEEKWRSSAMYKLDRVRASWCELEGEKEKNIGAGPHPGAYIGTSKRLDHGPNTYIPLQLIDFGQKV